MYLRLLRICRDKAQSKKGIIHGIGIFFFLAVLAQSYFGTDFNSLSYKSNCGTLLHHGRWLKNYTKVDPEYWQPEDCTMYEYNTETICKCFGPGTKLLFLGDSTARQIFWETASIIDSSIEPDGNMHDNIHLIANGIEIHMLWDPYLNKSDAFGEVQHIAFNDEESGKSTFLYVTTGLWHAMFEPRAKVIENYKQSVDKLVNVLETQLTGAFGSVYFGPTQVPQFQLLDDSRKDQITEEYLSQMNAYTNEVFNYDPNSDSQNTDNGILYTSDGRVGAYYTPVFNIYGPGHITVYDDIGLHYLKPVLSVQVQTLFNHHCNKFIMHLEEISHKTTCCISYSHTTNSYNFVIALMCVVAFFGILLFISASGRNFPYVLQPIVLIFTMTFIASLYAYLCDRTHSVNKQYNIESKQEFAIYLHLVLLCALLTLDRKYELSRTASNFLRHPFLLHEWKGFVISVWLVINLTGISKAYIQGQMVSKILETSLIFTETYEYTLRTLSGEVQFLRLGIDLLRINLCSLVLSWLLNTGYFFYGLPAKISFWHAVVFIGFGISQRWSKGPNSIFATVTKLGVLVLTVRIMVDKLWKPFSDYSLQFPLDLHNEFGVGVLAIALGLMTSNDQLGGAIVGYVQHSRITRIAWLCIVSLASLSLTNGLILESQENEQGFHQIMALGLIFVFFSVRYYIIITSHESNSEAIYYSAGIEWLGKSWNEMFVLSFHTLLAGDGTLRLFLLTTGTTDDNSGTIFIRTIINTLLIIVTFMTLSRSQSAAWETLMEEMFRSNRSHKNFYWSNGHVIEEYKYDRDNNEEDKLSSNSRISDDHTTIVQVQENTASK